MANNQSQDSRNQSGGGRKSAGSSSDNNSSISQSSSQNSQSQNSQSQGSDPIEQAISKAVHSLVTNLEPQLNRVATQIVNRAMSRGQTFADTGVRRMQDQPWYMVGGALALVAVGVGLLFAFEAPSSEPDFSRSQVQ